MEVKTGPTAEQRAWIAELGILVGAPVADAADAEAAAGPSSGKQKSAPARQAADREDVVAPADASARTTKALAGDKSGLVGGLIPDPVDVLKDVAGPLSATCKVSNNTKATLKLDPKSLEEKDGDSGEFKSPPPPQIEAEKDGEFVGANKTSVPILNLHFAGIDRRVTYFLDDEQKTTWTLHFVNPREGKNHGDATLGGPNKDQFESLPVSAGDGNDATYLFTLNAKGGSKPDPKPGPSTDVSASCQITVLNNTNSVLTLRQQGHERGDFMSFPNAAVGPNLPLTTFISVETPREKDPDKRGCKGFVVWEIGSAGSPAVVATWRIEWDNPLGEKNTAQAKIDPPTSAFKSLEQIGQGDENVPVSFTISGGGDAPGPKPPEPEPAFEPPGAERQPTLRKGDKSGDGWVEYLQETLNFKLRPSAGLTVSGTFDDATLKAVIAFQKQEKLQVDGIAGNQTWAALRQGAPEKPSTDGRAAHTFVEHGVKARWFLERGPAVYQTNGDRVVVTLCSVGDTKIEPGKFVATLRVTPPGSKPKVVTRTIPETFARMPTDDGDLYAVSLDEFRATFKIGDQVPTLDDLKNYVVEAYLEKALSGDFWSGNIQVV
jgi:peptidoglycan hydrolase-like protein with peptidoglycan-binding domain